MILGVILVTVWLSIWSRLEISIGKCVNFMGSIGGYKVRARGDNRKDAVYGWTICVFVGDHEHLKL